MIASGNETLRTRPVGAGGTPCQGAPLPADDLKHILVHTAELLRELDGKRIFITGGTGFFGIWLLETIAYANDQLGICVSATVLSRDPQAFLARMPHLAKRGEFGWVLGHPTSFAFPNTPNDYLLHLATATSAHLGTTDAAVMLKTKLASISHVLDFARHAGIRRMLVTSSGAIYGPQPRELSHIPETYTGAPDPLDPVSAYGNGKRLVEQMCALAPDVEIVIARCFSFIGPHLPLDARFAAGNFIRDALAGGPIKIKGDGSPVRSYLYAADLTIWLITLLLKGRASQAYNVGSDAAVNLAELAQSVARVAGGMVVDIAKPRSDGSAERYVPAIDKVRTELGLDVRVALESALERSLAWAGSPDTP